MKAGWLALLTVAAMLATSAPTRSVAPAAAPIGEAAALAGGAWAYVPAAADREEARVLVLLHGAGGQARRILAVFRAAADARGVILVAPQSAGRTWDMIEAAAGRRRGFSFAGGDSARIEQAIGQLRRRWQITPARVVLGGFSDGASFALSLGPARPGLYHAMLAFSPGFVVRPTGVDGRQPVFIAHGRSDRILSFERSGQAVAAQLRAAGHPVAFFPFDGGHEMPAAAIAAGMELVHRSPRPSG